MISILFVAVAVILLGFLLFAPFAKGTMWRATVTPLGGCPRIEDFQNPIQYMVYIGSLNHYML